MRTRVRWTLLRWIDRVFTIAYGLAGAVTVVLILALAGLGAYMWIAAHAMTWGVSFWTALYIIVIVPFAYGYRRAAQRRATDPPPPAVSTLPPPQSD
jgi:hypothetical protein